MNVPRHRALPKNTKKWTNTNTLDTFRTDRVYEFTSMQSRLKGLLPSFKTETLRLSYQRSVLFDVDTKLNLHIL